MAGADYAGTTATIDQLERLSGSLTVYTLGPALDEIGRLVAVPPPGDPAGINRLARAFRTAGTAATSVAAEVGALATHRLPAVWRGGAAGSAGEVVRATGALVGETEPAFEVAVRVLEHHADEVADQQLRHTDLHDQLDGARQRASVLIADTDWTQDTDYFPPTLHALGTLAARVDVIVSGFAVLYRESLADADVLHRRLIDVAGRARAGRAVAGGMPIDLAVVTAGAAIGGGRPGVDDTVLSPAQLERAGRLRATLSPTDRAALDAALRDADGPAARAYVLKALAAGHPPHNVLAFAAQIDGRDDAWLRKHLSLVDPGDPGEVRYRGVLVEQVDQTTCGSASLMMARAMNDPAYALWLTSGDDPGALGADSAAAFADRMGAEQQRIHVETTAISYPADQPAWGFAISSLGPPWSTLFARWPMEIGTSPWGVSDGLDEHAPALGTTYDWRLVDAADSTSAGPALQDVVTGVDAGHPVPLLIGDRFPQHYVLVVGHDGDQLLVYEPSAGEVVQVPQQDFLDGDLDLAGWSRVHGLVTPVPGSDPGPMPPPPTAVEAPGETPQPVSTLAAVPAPGATPVEAPEPAPAPGAAPTPAPSPTR